MIEVVLSETEYARFTAEAKKRMRMRRWKNFDLARKIGRPVESVNRFFSAKGKPSRFLAAEIALALDMTPKDWK